MGRIEGYELFVERIHCTIPTSLDKREMQAKKHKEDANKENQSKGKPSFHDILKQKAKSQGIEK